LRAQLGEHVGGRRRGTLDFVAELVFAELLVKVRDLRRRRLRNRRTQKALPESFYIFAAKSAVATWQPLVSEKSLIRIASKSVRMDADNHRCLGYGQITVKCRASQSHDS
jgi:hypothetical protein